MFVFSLKITNIRKNNFIKNLFLFGLRDSRTKEVRNRFWSLFHCYWFLREYTHTHTHTHTHTLKCDDRYISIMIVLLLVPYCQVSSSRLKKWIKKEKKNRSSLNHRFIIICWFFKKCPLNCTSCINYKLVHQLFSFFSSIKNNLQLSIFTRHNWLSGFFFLYLFLSFCI